MPRCCVKVDGGHAAEAAPKPLSSAQPKPQPRSVRPRRLGRAEQAGRQVMESTGWREVVSSHSYQIFFPGQPLERQESKHRGGFSSWCRPTCLGLSRVHNSNPSLFGFPGAVKIKTPLNRELVATYELTISVHDNASEVIDRSVSVPNGKHGHLLWRRPGSMGARCLSQPPAQPPGPWPPSPSQAHMRRCEIGVGAPLAQ